MARLATKPVEGEWEMRPGEGISDYRQRTDAMLLALTTASVAVQEGCVVGVVLCFPVADGHAMYLVSKESPLTLQHVPYGDAWRIALAHIRGIRKADVLEQAGRSHGWPNPVR